MLVLGLGGIPSAPGAETPSRALTPAESLVAFQLEPGLHIELVAAEPLVSSPVAFAFDEKGRLYVVENRGYPDPIDGSKVPAQGRIALLEDTDGDGRYDKRTEFATGLTYPNGICLWRGGVFVTCAPDIYYFKDNTGSGVADEKRVVLTGFSANKTAQVRMSHPTLGLDGKIYVTSGLNSGKVYSPDHPDRPPVTFSASDSRFDPDTAGFEVTGGKGQFGLAMDDFGRRFNCSNRRPIMQVILEPWQLKRNPFLAFSNMVQEVSMIEYDAKVSPISHATVTAAYMPSLMNAPHSGTFTSACGLAIYRGTGLGTGFDGNAFVCEPAQNLVQRQVIRPAGASFRADVPNPEREFLASADVWFRPVFCANGPNGDLYIADMYRKEIDHPEYVPEEARKKLDFESGRSAGRIYRVARRESKPAGRAWTAVTTGDLVKTLGSGEGWQRDTAYRLLLEQKDPAASALLAETVMREVSPAARVRALWLLHTFHSLDPAVIVAALKDRDARVRENAVQLAGAFAESSTAVRNALLELAADEDARVRFECALQLASQADASALPRLVAIAARDGADQWTRAAVLSGLGTRFPEFFQQFRQRQDVAPLAYIAVMNDLGQLFGAAGTPEACRQMLLDLAANHERGEDSARLSSILGLAEGLRARRKVAGHSSQILTGLLDAKAPSADADRHSFEAFFSRAAELAGAGKASLADRITAINLLGYADFARYGATLGQMLQTGYSAELQIAAVHAIDLGGDPGGAALLVERTRWAGLTPRVREAAITTLTNQPAYLEIFFAAVEKGDIPATDINSLHRGQLLRNKNAEVRKRAASVFHGVEGGDRMQAYQASRTVLALSSDAGRGYETFTKICSACHSYGGFGGHVGPELTGIKSQPAEAILLHIIVPNYEIAPGYQAFSLEGKDGRVIAGWLVGETDTSVSLRTVAEGDATVLRSNIRSLSAASTSLMPDGLEKTMTAQELADLIAYLKAGK